ncbi:ABC transporter permease [Vibrio owensii]|uniref:ABC transporter permease n=1 Tax=Vibrio owensii TaxID=696485 RepID=UPI0018F2796F|nr:ABC transporter permease [Vibrio owensii]
MWPAQKQRTPIQVFIDVSVALLYRECKTRFGDRKLGVFWILLEPLILIVGMSIIFTVRGREGLGMAELPVFIATGLVPLFLFRKGVSKGMKAISSNKGLFIFPLVRPFPAIISRVVVELIVAAASLVVLVFGFAWLDYSAFPSDFTMVFAAYVLLTLITLGFSLGMCSLYERMNVVDTLWSLLSMPLMILSGAIVPILLVAPPQYHELLLLNPILEALELIRFYWLTDYPTPVDVDDTWFSLFCWSVGSMFFGLSVYRCTWQKMVSL